MADGDVVKADPDALAQLLEEVSGLKEMWGALRTKHQDRPTRGKYTQACNELENNDLPFIELSRAKFTNESVSSINSQFKRAAEKAGLSYTPSVVEFNDSLILVNFDADQAEQKFDAWIMKKAGIDAATLASVTRDLDAATR
jgi:hypothetical protein